MSYFKEEVKEALVNISELLEVLKIERYSIIGSTHLVLRGLLDSAEDIDIVIDKKEILKLIDALSKRGVDIKKDSDGIGFLYKDMVYIVRDEDHFKFSSQPFIHEKINVDSRSVKIRPISFILEDYAKLARGYPYIEWDEGKIAFYPTKYTSRLEIIRERLAFFS